MNDVDVDYGQGAVPNQKLIAKSQQHGPGGSERAREKWSKETYIALLAMLGIFANLIARFGMHASVGQYTAPLILILLIGGAPLLFDLLRRMVRREFGSDLLAGLSIAASALLGEYLAGSIVVLMLSGGTALEHYATRRASPFLALWLNACRELLTGLQSQVSIK